MAHPSHPLSWRNPPTSPNPSDGVNCSKLLEGTGASTVQDILVAVYLIAAVTLVAVRTIVRMLAPPLAAAGCCLVAPRIIARDDADGEEVAFARGVFSPPTGEPRWWGACFGGAEAQPPSFV